MFQKNNNYPEIIQKFSFKKFQINYYYATANESETM